MMNFGFQGRFFKNQKEKKKEPKSSYKKKGGGQGTGHRGGALSGVFKKNEDTTFGRESLEEERRTLKKK